MRQKWAVIIVCLMAIFVFSSGAFLASPAALAEEQYEKSVREDLMVPMRDDRKLATSVFLPAKGEEAVEGQFPVLVLRTPYNKDAGWVIGQAKFFAKNGYAVVVQDVRGKFASEGVFYPYRSEGHAEAKDGYDTVEWAAAQPWSNGKVGTYGISFMAGTQWALAHNEKLPPHLKAMAPGYSVASYYGQGGYAGGALLWAHNSDYLLGFGRQFQKRHNPQLAGSFTDLDMAQEVISQLYWDLPVWPFEPLKKVGIDWLYNGWHAHETYDDYWKAQDHALHYQKVNIPVLNYGGWYDIFCQGTVLNYAGMRKNAATSEAREQTMLIMGPYTHGREGRGSPGQVTGHAYFFPSNVTYDSNKLLLAWFDHHLKGEEFTLAKGPRGVWFYVPGLDKWIAAEDYPVPETRFSKWFLHSPGNANAGNLPHTGRLTTEPPALEPPDSYVYDPGNPVPTVGGYNTHCEGGITDRPRVYGQRQDILVYQTELLKEDIAVVGPITVTLHASTSAVDTDFVVVLSDVDPGSRTGAYWIAEGARRGRIGNVEGDPRDLNTYSKIEYLEPGKIYTWKIAVWPTARVFKKGHRIRIDVASSNFPRYNRNLNTGEGLKGVRMVNAVQTLFHDKAHPSSIELPIIPIDKLNSLVVEGPPQ